MSENNGNNVVGSILQGCGCLAIGLFIIVIIIIL